MRNEPSDAFVNENAKWQELVRHTSLTLRDMGYTVTAEVMKGDEFGSYDIQNVRLSRVHDVGSKLDMFSPNIGSKSVCGVQCELLRKISSVEKEANLSLFVKQNEGDLFTFFGDWKTIDELIKVFREASEGSLKEYLDYIRVNLESQNSLSEFSQKFKSLLTSDMLVKFTKTKSVELNPSNSRRLSKFGVAFDNRDLPDDWDSAEKPREHWLSDNELSKDEIAMANTVELENELVELEGSIVKGWQKAKKIDLYKGMGVCTYSDNSFGTIVSLRDGKASISVKGQVKLLYDGLLVEAPSGYLFGNTEALLFVDINAEIIYPIRDIAACSVDV